MQFDSSFFDQQVDRKGTCCLKWDNIDMLPRDGIPLWVADMDFECAPAIREALIERAKHPSYGYTFADESSDQAVIDFWKRRHGVDLTRKDLLMMPSVVSGLRASVLTMTKPQDKIMLLTPIYGPFFAAVKDSGRILVDVPLHKDQENRYHINFAGIEAGLRNGVSMLMLCSPHNPVSRIWSKAELTQIVDLCKKYGCQLVVDEIHADFVYQPKEFVSILSLENLDKRTVCMTAASKTFNIAGIKQSYLFCRDQDTLLKIREFFEHHGAESGNIFALTATKAAYSSCDEWLDGLLAYLSENRQIVYREIASLLPKAKVTPIEATYLAWIDLSDYGIQNPDLIKRCYERGVMLTDGVFFGEEQGKLHMRLNFGCPREQLIKGIQRFASAVLNQ